MPIRKVFREPADFGPLRIRLQRVGARNNAFYNIVVAQARHRQQNKSVHDVLGTYYPHASYSYKDVSVSDEPIAAYKHITLHFDRCKAWLAQGAEPSSMVSKILSKAGLWPSPPRKVEVMNVRAIQHKAAAERSS
ncbi:hypothetical protein MP228_005088 [Amoeboaphelidium protococcarum]|nr:hypothetical protein MP228_005088 [Amoeboaphelidium protococcarum]